ncbi:MAG TPA: isoprenylcysteine carboxylmethyltransferase family protein [Draconibacterium sp.]|nr:isoprenylcysteine carboxylmethyltransferase family protein [Draconibacterium sp.]HRX10529.1 isoprenylcysteine carboxylmethyltransferase family protein [Draconibacterium sp.]
MNSKFISASGLDARGVGPRIMLATAPVLVAAILFEIKSAPFTEIATVRSAESAVIGWIWLITGLAAFIATMIQFISNFPKGELITTGMYAVSRNPIYSCWIIFILPATGMICNNWIFFAAALVMGIVTTFLVREEEVQLLKCYGEKYYEYKNRVGLIFSLPQKIKALYNLN